MENEKNPYARPSSNVRLATRYEVSFFKSWIIFFLIASVGGALLGALFGVIIGGIMGSAGVPLNVIKLISGAVGFVISLPISFFTFKWSVNKFIVAPLLDD